jgi:hypothetical protein
MIYEGKYDMREYTSKKYNMIRYNMINEGLKYDINSIWQGTKLIILTDGLKYASSQTHLAASKLSLAASNVRGARNKLTREGYF